MKALLINPPTQVDHLPEIPSLGISYITHELRKNGHSVEVLDIDGHRYPKEEITEFLKNIHVDIIGIGGLITVYPYLYWLVSEIKRLKPDIEIILGGSIVSALKERCFERFDIDYEVIGEGEVTIVELLKEIGSTRNFASVKGIAYRNASGKVVFTEKRPLIPSLDEVPMFNDSLFPMENYLRNSKWVMQIHAQRGCPSNCTFCFNYYRAVSNNIRYRPVHKVVDEIEFFKNKYKNRIKLYAVSGKCITMNKKWLIDFASEILKRKLKINYRVTSRVDTIDEERLKWLKRSGCVMMSLGIESGSEKIIKIMKKGASREQNMKAVRLAKKYIKTVEASLILGYEGETYDTLEETVRFAKEMDLQPSTFFATAFPGTELYRMALEKGRIKDEEKYMMAFDKITISEWMVNLSDMPDEDAEKTIRKAMYNIKKFYYSRKPWIPIKLAFTNLKENGIKVVLGKASQLLRA